MICSAKIGNFVTFKLLLKWKDEKRSTTSFFFQLTCGFAQRKIWNQFRKVSKDVEYADSKTSPLTKEDLASFKTDFIL
jgi:hypothetical protein